MKMNKRELFVCWLVGGAAYIATAAATAWLMTLFSEREEPVTYLGSLGYLVGGSCVPFLISALAAFRLMDGMIAKAKNLVGLIAAGCGAAALICAVTPSLMYLGMMGYSVYSGEPFVPRLLAALFAVPIIGIVVGSPGIVVFGPVLGTLLWEARITQSAKTCTQIPSL